MTVLCNNIRNSDEFLIVISSIYDNPFQIKSVWLKSAGIQKNAEKRLSIRKKLQKQIKNIIPLLDSIDLAVHRAENENVSQSVDLT